MMFTRQGWGRWGQHQPLHNGSIGPTPQYQPLLDGSIGPAPQYQSLLDGSIGPTPQYQSLQDGSIGPTPQYQPLLDGSIGPAPQYQSLLDGSIGPTPQYQSLQDGSIGPTPQYQSLQDGSIEPSKRHPAGHLSSRTCRSFLVKKSDLLFCMYIPLYWCYLFLGAALFSQIEGPIEQAHIYRLKHLRSTFLKKHSCVPDEDLEELIVEIISANNRGVSAARNVTSEPNWSFGQSFFFSSTIVSTIGYGHVHPLSEGGKIFCIIYAIIGIPMTFILLTALVERMLIPTTWLLYWLNSKLGHLYQPFNIRVFHLTIIGVISFVLFMVFPSLIFAKLEPGWDFLDSLYYCFISLTTIGLGDYIPGDAQDQPLRPLYKVCITGYLLLGLTFIMLLLHLYNDIPQLNLGLFLLRGFDTAPGDPERMRLSGTGVAPKYTQHNDQPVRQNVKVVSRPVDSPSPEEDTTPVHAQMPPIIPANQ